MPCRIGIFCPKRRAKSINLRKPHGSQFAFQLPAHCKICGPSEKIFFEIHFTEFITRRLIEWQRGYFEHLTRPFRVGGCDNGGMQVNKPPLVKKLVYCKGKGMPHTEHRSKGIRPKTQVGDLSQEFKTMFFRLKRKFFCIT